jgi:hypothetical protein
MIGRTYFVVVVAAIWLSPTFAQSSLGGPKKQQNFIGGPTSQKNPVVPSGRGEVTNPTQSVAKKPKK